MRGGFGDHFAWQAQYLVNLDDVLKGLKVSFCETVIIFDLGHDDSLWQAQHFGCLGLIFHGRRSTLPGQKHGRNLSKTFFLTLPMFMFCGAHNVLGKSNMCSRNHLVTLRVSDRSRCVAVRILISRAVQILTWLAQPSRQFVQVGSLSLWRRTNFDGSRNLLGTLSLLDRSRCGAVLILDDSLTSWKKDLMNSPEGPSIRILQEFHGAALEIPNLWRSWSRSCRGPCEKMLWRSWWNPVRGPCVILHRSYEKILWRSCWHLLRGPCMILYRSLAEDLAEILVRSSLRGPCMKILQMPCIRGACMKALLGCSWKVLISRSCNLQDPLQQLQVLLWRSCEILLGALAWRSWPRCVQLLVKRSCRDPGEIL